MDNPLKPQKKEEVLFGGQMSIIIGFIAVFLLGVMFVFILGNLLSQVSDGVQQVNLELSGNKNLVIQTAAAGCLVGNLQVKHADTLANTDKTNAEKTDEILATYDAENLATLSANVLACTQASTPAYLDRYASGTVVEKTGNGFSVEAALASMMK